MSLKPLRERLLGRVTAEDILDPENRSSIATEVPC